MARKRGGSSDSVTCRHCGRKFRAITFRHLRNIHGYECEHPILEYKAEFDLPFAMSRETRRKISQAKDEYWDDRGQHWTPKAVIAEIRRIHRAGDSLRPKKVPVKLQLAARRLFGGWRVPIEKAGLDYEEVCGYWRWTSEKVVRAIQELAECGVPLSASYAEANHLQLFNAAANHFSGSWGKALRAAGYAPEQHRKPRGRWGRRLAEAWLGTQVAKGRSILAKNVPRDLIGFVHKRLRTGWIEFVESHGMPYPGIKKRRDWTKPKLLSEIRRWRRAGHRMNYRAVQAEYQALIHQARKFCRSWDAACAEAGVRNR